MKRSRRRPATTERAEACPTCGASIVERFCGSCGEMRASAREASLKEFLEHAFEAFTHADGRVVATFRALLFAPGKLTAEYFAGRRKPYVAPLQVFLISNFVFFLIESALRWNALSVGLWQQTEKMPYRRVAKPIAEAFASGKNMSLDELAVGFDSSAATLAKTLVIVMAPVFALFVAPLGRGRGLVAHVVVALHFLAFFLLTQSALLVAATPLAWIARAREATIESATLDVVLTLILCSALAIHSWHVIRRVHAYRGARLFAATAWLLAGFVVTLYVYRALLFLLALNAQR